MSKNGSNHHPRTAVSEGDSATPPASARKRRTPWGLVVVALLFVVVPFMSWYGTSFWRGLSDEEIGEYLEDRQKLRHVQHALEEIDRRIVSPDTAIRESAKRWYPQIVRVAADPSPELRLAAAWVMGDDNTSEEFHAALVPLLGDPEPSVRRMAALSLSRFNDPRCRDELLAVFRPYSVKAQTAGTVLTILSQGSEVRRGALVARVQDAAGQVQDLRSPLSGRVETLPMGEGATVAAGEEVMKLAPDGDNVLQALRALFVVGRPEDLQVIEPYARGVAGMPEAVKNQAAQTSKEIVRRASAKQQ